MFDGEIRNKISTPILLNRKAISYRLTSDGLIATAKHFPGHGDTDVDSHTELPLIKADLERLDSVEL